MARRSCWLFSLTLSLSCFLLALACADGSEGGGADNPNDPLVSPPTSVEIKFVKSGPIRLTAGDSIDLKVRVTYEEGDRPDQIQFAVFGNSGSAFLNASVVALESNDTATVTLTAPSEDAFFLLRAAAGGASAEVEVNVAVRGFTQVAITPNYSGSRVITTWEGSVHIGKECSSLEGSPPPEGERRTSAAPEEVILIQEVPIGQSVAVVVRAEKFVGGCQTINNLLAGETFQVVVDVADRPMRLDALDLDLEFNLNSTSEFNGALDAVSTQMVNQATSEQGNDLVALLDAMQASASTPEDETAFSEQRDRLDWDTLLTTGALGNTPPDSVRARLSTWLTAGIDSLYEGPLFKGKVVDADQAPGTAFLELELVAGLEPNLAGFPDSPLITTSAEPGDTLLLGTTIAWLPNALVLSLSENVIADLGFDSVPEALSEQLSCTTVAQTLVRSNSPNDPEGEAFRGCDADCLVTLCDQALELFWDRIVNVPPELAQLELNCAGPASIDGEAEVTAYQASWVGSANLAGLQQLPVTGTVRSIDGDESTNDTTSQ